MYSTYNGAKNRARALQRRLSEIDLHVRLNVCQRAIARGGDYRDWTHLRSALTGAEPHLPSLLDFADRACLEMPRRAVEGTRQWADNELSILRLEKREARPENRERSASLLGISLGAMHRTHTPLLLPGSPPGMRLRLKMVNHLSLAAHRSRADPESLTLTYEGSLEKLLPLSFEHAHFKREFERLVDAGIFQWREETYTLILRPPLGEVARQHFELCQSGMDNYLQDLEDGIFDDLARRKPAHILNFRSIE